MKVTCNTTLEAPLINLIKLYDSLNVKGVCGILTPNSKHNVENTTISALGLLSYCNELEVHESTVEKIQIVDVTIAKGPINYFGIANSSGGILTVPSHLTEEPFAMATEEVRIKLLVGVSTVSDPLLEQDVYNFVASNVSKGYEFTAVPLPLLGKKLIQFKTTKVNGESTIQCIGVSDTILEDLFSSLKVTK